MHYRTLSTTETSPQHSRNMQEHVGLSVSLYKNVQINITKM